jgi:hypothetical protein
MKITIKIGLLFASIWILVKVIYHSIIVNSTDLKPVILTNMFLLICAISVGLYLHKKQEGYKQGNALSDIKNGLTSGVIYTVMVSVFIFSYYSFINPEFNEHQISEIKTEIKKELDRPEGLKKIKASQDAFEVMTKEQIYKELIKGPETLYTAKSTFFITMLSLLLLSTLFSILITVIYRTILFRNL